MATLRTYRAVPGCANSESNRGFIKFHAARSPVSDLVADLLHALELDLMCPTKKAIGSGKLIFGFLTGCLMKPVGSFMLIPWLISNISLQHILPALDGFVVLFLYGNEILPLAVPFFESQ